MFINPAGRLSRKRPGSGANTQINFNNSGSTGSDSNFTWNYISDILTVGNSTLNVAVSVVSGMDIGNSTVNSSLNATALIISAISGTTTGLALTNTSLTIGNSTVNAIISFPTGMTMGNSTATTLSNSSAMAVGTINSTAVGVLMTNSSITIGNSSINTIANSTTFSGIALTANNATNLGGVAAASYLTTTGNFTRTGNSIFSGTAVGGIPLTVTGVASATANLFSVGNATTAAQFAVNSIGVAVGNGAGLTSCQPAPGASLVIAAGVTTVNLTATSGLSKTGGMSVLANAGIVANSTGTWAQGAGLKSFSVITPTAGDMYTLFWTNTAITLSEIVTVHTNTAAGAWCNTTFWMGTTLGTGTGILLSNTANGTTGFHNTTFANTAVAANSWIWCNVNAVGVNTLSFAATIRFS